MSEQTGITRRKLLNAGLSLPALHAARPSAAQMLDDGECIVPAKVGGGFDLTCKLVGTLIAQRSPSSMPLKISYMPGGIGAVAYDRMVTGRLPNRKALVAFSGGSLLNLAQGKFGPHRVSDVRWVAAVGTDYGAIAVPRDSTIKTLPELQKELRRDLSKVVFGAGGTVGSQDWVKAALIVKSAGLDHRGMRFVSFEGGGEAIAALEGRHVTVFCGDAAEALQAADGGALIRVLAVLADKRMVTRPEIPTGSEQGVNLVWPVIRGVYVGHSVSESEYEQMIHFFRESMARSGYPQLRLLHGLSAFSLVGESLREYVFAEVARYRELAKSLGLRVSQLL